MKPSAAAAGVLEEDLPGQDRVAERGMAADNADAEALGAILVRARVTGAAAVAREVVRIAERESIGPLRDDVAVLVVALERT
jgi:hypothetical protein